MLPVAPKERCNFSISPSRRTRAKTHVSIPHMRQNALLTASLASAGKLNAECATTATPI